MHEPALTLVAIGGFMLLGLLTDLLGHRTPLPRVTLLLLLGVAIGPTGFDVLPAHTATWFPLVTDMALVMVGFLLGGALTVGALRRHGGTVLWLSASIVVATAVVVGLGLLALGAPGDIALLLAGIATATDPAATLDVAREVHARGSFTTILRGVVAADDAWGLIVFSLLLCGAGMWNGELAWAVLADGAHELGGAVLLGIALGVPMAYLTGRIRPGEPTLFEALGLVFLCGGIALWLEVSFLLAAMVMGCVVANLARHHRRPFHAIEGIERPFLVVFFLLSGAALRLDSLATVGAVGVAYVGLRVLGRWVGTQAGGALGAAGPPVRRWMGLALLPQAGVALGMALVAAERFPHHADVLLPVAVGGTVLFELIGPVATRIALRRAGDVKGPGGVPAGATT
ncbi:MAG: cation:proton antiporter [Planctomycetota bacterium]|jgi:Kef-type K+ transport system membrane component KefB